MTPQEALKVLTDSTASLNSNRQGHLALIQALQVIEQLIKKEEEKKVDAVPPTSVI